MIDAAVAPFGRLVGRDTSSELRIYNLPTDPGFGAHVADQFMWTVGVFSFPDSPPNFARSYPDRHVWIYDPAKSHGAFRFPDWSVEDAVAYTRAWRVSHEIGHGRRWSEIERRFGPGRRSGKLGAPLTAREAARAIAWEDAAFHEQRHVLACCGVHVSDEDFGREWRINMADAVHRVLTGDFSDPGPDGFLPNDGPLEADEVEAAFLACGADVAGEYRRVQ